MSRVNAVACATALLAVALALPAAAQDQRLNGAWEAALSEGAGYLEPGELALINEIAYHAAVSKLCDGYPLDLGEIAEATNAVVAGATEGLADTALIDRHTDVLISVGTAQGLFLAEGSLDPEAFCAEAAEARADAEYNDHWK